jgi:tRNA threonylcarbamoyladenosine biosynthesis protein TsaE
LASSDAAAEGRGAATVADEEGTAAAAVQLAALLRAGDVVHLRGPLGAGKTAFVRHAARALGVREPVTSPTFTVAHRYAGPVPVSHLDLYRSERMTVEELADLDPYLGPEAVVFVEWPDAGAGLLPDATWTVEIDHRGGDARLLDVRRTPASPRDGPSAGAATTDARVR